MPRHEKRKSAGRPTAKGGSKSQPLQFFVMENAGQDGNEWNSSHIDLPLLNIQHNFNAIEILKIELYSEATTPTLICIGSRDLKGVIDSTYTLVNMLRDKSFFFHTKLGVGPATGISISGGNGDSTTTPITAQAFDLTNNGRGIYYPAQRFFFNTQQTQPAEAPGITNVVAAKIYYKLHTLSAQEQLAMINQYIVSALD